MIFCLGNVKFQYVEDMIYNSISFMSHHTYLGMPQIKVKSFGEMEQIKCRKTFFGQMQSFCVTPYLPWHATNNGNVLRGVEKSYSGKWSKFSVGKHCLGKCKVFYFVSQIKVKSFGELIFLTRASRANSTLGNIVWANAKFLCHTIRISACLK